MRVSAQHAACDESECATCSGIKGVRVLLSDSQPLVTGMCQASDRERPLKPRCSPHYDSDRPCTGSATPSAKRST